MNESEFLRSVANDPEMIQKVHIKIEDLLVMMRDANMSLLPFPANGLVIREYDGSSSDVIRIGTHFAIKRILEALAEELEREGT